jgi:hypothetical protein
MTVRAVVTASVITLVAVTGAWAQSDVPGPGDQDGVVARVDSAADVVQLADGRLFRVAPGTEILVRGAPTATARLTPGTNVIIRGGQEVEYRDGQYVPIPE